MQVLTIQDQQDVAGGITWGQVGVGLAMVSLGITVAATGGLALMPLGAIAFAGASTDFVLAGTAFGLAAGGGAMIGIGMQQ